MLGHSEVSLDIGAKEHKVIHIDILVLMVDGPHEPLADGTPERTCATQLYGAHTKYGGDLLLCVEHPLGGTAHCALGESWAHNFLL